MIGPVIWPTKKFFGCNLRVWSQCCEKRSPKFRISSMHPSGRIRSGCVAGAKLSSVQKHSMCLLSGGWGMISR